MRLFISINPNNELKNALSETIANLREAATRGRYTAWDNLHLTLAFIGESERVQDILAIMHQVVRETVTEPIQISLSDAGIFKNKGGDTHWVGVQKTTELASLADNLTKYLAAEGFKVDKRRYLPHITIGQKVTLPPGAQILIHPASMQASHISLMRSDLSSEGANYTEIARVALA
jgi:2'-5' RNA ligase